MADRPMAYRFLDHTADVQAECRAQSFTGLLETAARALYSVALKDKRKSVCVRRDLFVSGAGREEVLVRWLQELVFLLETEGFVAVRFTWSSSHMEAPNGPCSVQCDAEGYLCAPEERGEEVKGVSYHGLVVEKRGEEFIARVILDL